MVDVEVIICCFFELFCREIFILSELQVEVDYLVCFCEINDGFIGVYGLIYVNLKEVLVKYKQVIEILFDEGSLVVNFE